MIVMQYAMAMRKVVHEYYIVTLSTFITVMLKEPVKKLNGTT